MNVDHLRHPLRSGRRALVRRLVEISRLGAQAAATTDVGAAVARLEAEVADLGAQLRATAASADAEARARQEAMDGRSPLHRLRRLLDGVEMYQPLFGLDQVSLGFPAPQRPCVDRAEAITGFLGAPAGLRVLDVGSSLGYFSLQLAARGASVVGIDNDPRNVAVAEEVASLATVPGVQFRQAVFDERFVDALVPDDFDVCLLLSVIHHRYAVHGVDATHELVHELLRRVPLVIIELAHGGEDHAHPWVTAAPVDPLASLLGDGRLAHRHLGDFPTHLSSTTRPLVAIWRQDVVQVNGRSYDLTQSDLRSHAGASVAWGRRFGTNAQVFVKRYSFSSSQRDDNRRQLVNEIAAYQLLEAGRRQRPTHRFPAMVDWEIATDHGTIILNRLDGVRLDELSCTPAPEVALRCLVEVCDALIHLREVAGLFHNDLRAWNVLLTDGGVALFDLGCAGPVEVGDFGADMLRLVDALGLDPGAPDAPFPTLRSAVTTSGDAATLRVRLLQLLDGAVGDEQPTTEQSTTEQPTTEQPTTEVLVP